jgi:amidase
VEEVTQLSAVEAVRLLRQGEVSPVEVVHAAIQRIEATDGSVNALPVRCFERALAAARVTERHFDRLRSDPRSLCGLPIVVKDMTDVAGVRCTYGSPLFADRVAQHSDIAVETLEQRGAIVISKSNTPEFASAGGLNTTNRLFGATRNPWNTALSCGGSSGGSAVEVATGQAWLATGTDLGGSLRQPASFCSVVGLRPTPGRVARSTELPHDVLCVLGPMGRTVSDVALMLDAMVAESARDPLSLPAPCDRYLDVARAPESPARVAFSRDLGLIPVTAEIADACCQAARRLQARDVIVTEDCPDFSSAREILSVLRPAWLAAHWGALVRTRGDELPHAFRHRLETGLALPARGIWDAERKRASLAQATARFFERYDVLACPTVPVAPFPLDAASVGDIPGLGTGSESDWMLLTYAVSLTGCPAISIPCAFTADGRPIGLQLIAAPRAERRLIAAAAMLESIIALRPATPIDPRRAE